MLYSYQRTEDKQPQNGLDAEAKGGRNNKNKNGAKEVAFNPGPFNAVNQFGQEEDGKTKATSLPGYLKPETMRILWAPFVKTAKEDSLNPDTAYGLGWAVLPASKEYAFCKNQR